MTYYSEEITLLGLPGPVTIHPKVLQAMNFPIYGHRTSHFRSIMKNCIEKFKPTIETIHTPLILAGSGSLGLHAAITNLAGRKEKILCLESGKFGERLTKIAQRFTDNSIIIRKKYGLAIKPSEVEEVLDRHKDVTLVTLTHNETSTAVLNPLPEISKILHKHDALLIADCITSAGGDLVKMDDWDIDFLVSGSQKCYGLPPGLAFVAFNERAEEKMQKVEKRDFYSDMLKFKAMVSKSFDTPFTPAINLIYALQASLNIIHKEGMASRIKRHQTVGELYREGLKALGIEIFSENGFHSNTVTASIFPSNIQGQKFFSYMKEIGILLANGQGSMKDKIWRTGHMNMVGYRELLLFISAVEYALKKCGHKFEIGSGVGAVIEKLAKMRH